MNKKIDKCLHKIMKSRSTIGKYLKYKHQKKLSYPVIKYFSQITNRNDIMDFREDLKKKNIILTPLLTNEDLNKINDNYQGILFDNDRIFVSDRLDNKNLEKTIVHELSHHLENDRMEQKNYELSQPHLFSKNKQEYEILDEINARSAEEEYINPDRRITRSITRKIYNQYIKDNVLYNNLE